MNEATMIVVFLLISCHLILISRTAHLTNIPKNRPEEHSQEQNVLMVNGTNLNDRKYSSSNLVSFLLQAGNTARLNTRQTFTSTFSKIHSRNIVQHINID